MTPLKARTGAARTGFTLVEVLMVVAVLSSIAAGAVFAVTSDPQGIRRSVLDASVAAQSYGSAEKHGASDDQNRLRHRFEDHITVI